MKEKAKKVLVWIFEFALFCGYFYVLFVGPLPNNDAAYRGISVDFDNAIRP